jgi:hypothetical protein
VSLSYSACAFFGTFALRRSEVGEILAKFIEHGRPAHVEHGRPAHVEHGRPAHVEHGLLIDEVGDHVMGETWVVLRGLFAPRASRDDKIEAPRLLEAMPATTRTIETWLRDRGIDPVGLPPIGWHFAATCM